MSDAFVEVVGQRMALLGRTTGAFELWQWPLKVAHALRFRIDGSFRAPDIVRPLHHELLLSWSWPGIQLSLRLFASRERRIVYAVFELEGRAELDVELSLSLDYLPMWPAGMGGQIARRDEETGALLLTEERGRFATLIGSPDAELLERIDERGLGDGEVVIRGQVRSGSPTLFLFAGAERDPGPLSEAAKRGEEEAAVGLSRAHAVIEVARGEWRRGLDAWRIDERELERHWASYFDGLLHLSTSDPEFDRAFLDAQAAIEKAWVKVDGLGLGLVAGLAPSGSGQRPGFGWFFDGDALIAARSLLLCGDHARAATILRFAASHVRADGKPMHELVLSARLCDWEDEYPYAYYKADNGPRFPAAAGMYSRVTGDEVVTNELAPVVERTLRWCESHEDEAGRLSNRSAGLAAVEAGPLVGRIESEAFLHGLWLEALARCEPEGERLERARHAFETFWSEEARTYAFARLDDGSLFTDSSAYLALPLARGFGQEQRARLTARRLNHPSLVTDWGARMFADSSEVYDPAHYNTGSVFPYLNLFVTLALYRCLSPTAGFQVLSSIAALSGFSGETFIPEHLLGDRARAPARGVPHQVFSSAALIEGTLLGPVGLDIDGREGRLVFTPALPASWDHLELERVRVAGSVVDLSLRRERGDRRTSLRLEVTLRSGPAVEIELEPRLPPLSRGGTGAITGVAPCRLEVEYRGGPQLVLPPPVIQPGAPSRGLRLTGEEVDGDAVVYELWGAAGEEYRVPVDSDIDWCVEAGARRDGDDLLISMSNGDEGEFLCHELRLHVDEGSQ